MITDENNPTIDIPDWPADSKEPVKCRAVDPHSGWLTDLTIKTAGDAPPAVPSFEATIA